MASQVVLRASVGGILGFMAVAFTQAGGVWLAVAPVLYLGAAGSLLMAGLLVWGVARYSRLEMGDGEGDATLERLASDPRRCPPNYHWDESMCACVPDND